MAINSDKVSTTNIAKSHSSGEFRWRDFTFFENCKDFCRALFLLCPHSLVCCNPIPKKGFFSLGICVPWCPRVSHGCSKPIKCCSRVPFPFDGQPAFSLGTPSPYKKETLPLYKLWLYWTPRPLITQHCRRHCHASW